MNINFFSQGSTPFDHLVRASTEISPVEYEGIWSTLELQPDLFVPQHFTVGVVIQADNDRLHYHLLSEFKKFECLYSNQFPKKMVAEMMSHAEEILRQAARNKTPINRVNFGSANLFFSQPHHTSGTSFEAVLGRLYNDVVVLEPSNTKKIRQFETLDTPAVRELVNQALKKIASFDYEKIVLDTKDGVLVKDRDRSHHLDINLKTRSACGSVVSAVYKTVPSIEMNLLRANLDLSTYAKIQDIREKGVFLMLPDRSSLDHVEWERVENVVGEHSWKLEQDGFRVVGMDTADAIASEIYEWAKPTI